MATPARVGNYLMREAATVWKDYRPGITEAKGLFEVTVGLCSLVYSTIWRLAESKDHGTDIPVANQAIEISLVITATGVIKLTLPLSLYTTYRAMHSWTWLEGIQ